MAISKPQNPIRNRHFETSKSETASEILVYNSPPGVTTNMARSAAELTRKKASSHKTVKASSPATREMTVNNFDLLTLVGKGAYGKVFLVRRKGDGKLFAMKVLCKKNIAERKQVNSRFFVC